MAQSLGRYDALQNRTFGTLKEAEVTVRALAEFDHITLTRSEDIKSIEGNERVVVTLSCGHQDKLEGSSKGASHSACPFRIQIEERSPISETSSQSESTSFVVADMCVEHNHPTSNKRSQSRLPSDRKLTREEIRRIEALSMANMPTKDIVKIIREESSHFVHPPDVYNAVARMRAREKNSQSDVVSFLAKLSSAPNVISYVITQPDMPVTTTEPQHLHSAFWAYIKSIKAFASVSDVLMIGTTKQVTRLDMTLVTVCAVSSSGVTYPLAFALVRQDLTSYHTWFMEKLWSAMIATSGRAEVATFLLTDFDEALISSINTVFPNSKCELCKEYIMMYIREQLDKLASECTAAQHEDKETFIEKFQPLIDTITCKDEADDLLQQLALDYPVFIQCINERLSAYPSFWLYHYTKNNVSLRLNAMRRMLNFHHTLSRHVKYEDRYTSIFKGCKVMQEMTLAQKENAVEVEETVANDEDLAWLESARQNCTPYAFQTYIIRESRALKDGCPFHINCQEPSEYTLVTIEGTSTEQRSYTVELKIGLPSVCDCGYPTQTRMPCRHIMAIYRYYLQRSLPAKEIHPRWQTRGSLPPAAIELFRNTPELTSIAVRLSALDPARREQAIGKIEQVLNKLEASQPKRSQSSAHLDTVMDVDTTELPPAKKRSRGRPRKNKAD